MKLFSLLLRSLKIILLILACTFQVFSQTHEIDSTEFKINAAKNDTVKIKILNDKIWDLMFNNKEQALVYVKQTLKLSETCNNPNSLSDTYNTIGTFYTIATDFEKALLYYQKTIQIRTKINDRKGLMKSYNNIGGVYKQLGSFKKEIEYYFLSLKMAEEFKDTLVASSILSNMGDAFGRQGQFDKAIEYQNKALSIREKLSNSKGILSCLINIATMYHKKKDYATSEKYYASAAALLKEVEDKYQEAIFHANYAALLKDEIKFPEAIKHIQQSIELNNLIGNNNNKLVNYINLASIYEELAKTQEANQAYQKSLALSQEIGNLQWERQSYLGLSTTYFTLKDFKKAFLNQLEYQKLKDSLENTELKTKFTELEKKFVTDKLKAENELLLEKNLVKELESKQRGYIITLMLIVFILLSGTAFFFWRKYTEKQQLKNVQIALDAEEKERQRIAKDIHDEFGSGLTKIRFMSEVIKNGKADISPAVLTISETSNSLVENMRDLIWVMNPENATLDNLVARIREYSGQYLEDFNIDLKFESVVDVPPIKISKEVNRNVFMVVKEALQNIVKHASATTVTITVLVDKDLIIEVKDNGSGIAIENKEGNGLKNMRYRTENLGGKYIVSSNPGNGTTIKIITPLT